MMNAALSVETEKSHRISDSAARRQPNVAVQTSPRTAVRAGIDPRLREGAALVGLYRVDAAEVVGVAPRTSSRPHRGRKPMSFSSM